MANQKGDWNRNRNGSTQNWGTDSNMNYRNQNPGNDIRRSGGFGPYGDNFDMDQNRSDYRMNYNSDRFRNEDDWNSNRGMYGSNDGIYGGDQGMYGSSEGMSRGRSDYSDRKYDWDNRSDAQHGYGRRRRSNDMERYNNNKNDNEERGWWDRTKDEVSSWFGDDEAERRRQMDERQQGQHRGKGPKGYIRSDERIKEDVNDRLSDDSNIDASNIDVTVENGEVTLTGTVSVRWEKRHAEDVAESVSGVKNVENRIRINANSNAGTQGSGTGSLNDQYHSSEAVTVAGYNTTKG